MNILKQARLFLMAIVITHGVSTAMEGTSSSTTTTTGTGVVTPTDNQNVIQYAPEDAIGHIVKRLSIKDLINFARTSKSLYYNQAGFWQRAIELHFPGSSLPKDADAETLRNTFKKYAGVKVFYKNNKGKLTYQSVFDDADNGIVELEEGEIITLNPLVGPDGMVYVVTAKNNSSYLSIIDPLTMQVTKKVPLGLSVRSAIFGADGRLFLMESDKRADYVYQSILEPGDLIHGIQPKFKVIYKHVSNFSIAFISQFMNNQISYSANPNWHGGLYIINPSSENIKFPAIQYEQETFLNYLNPYNKRYYMLASAPQSLWKSADVNGDRLKGYKEQAEPTLSANFKATLETAEGRNKYNNTWGRVIPHLNTKDFTYRLANNGAGLTKMQPDTWESLKEIPFEGADTKKFQDMTIGADGRLYVVYSDNLYVVDPETDQVTLQQHFTTPVGFDQFKFAVTSYIPDNAAKVAKKRKDLANNPFTATMKAHQTGVKDTLQKETINPYDYFEINSYLADARGLLKRQAAAVIYRFNLDKDFHAVGQFKTNNAPKINDQSVRACVTFAKQLAEFYLQERKYKLLWEARREFLFGPPSIDEDTHTAALRTFHEITHNWYIDFPHKDYFQLENDEFSIKQRMVLFQVARDHYQTLDNEVVLTDDDLKGILKPNMPKNIAVNNVDTTLNEWWVQTIPVAKALSKHYLHGEQPEMH